MKKTVYIRFTVILLILGFMLAVQYNTVKDPEIRDTRDIWTIRQELAKEMEIHSELLSEVTSLEETIGKYENMVNQSPEIALMETVNELKKDIGLEKFNGPGLELTIEPSLESMAVGEKVEEISPDLLIRLLNEINRFKAKAIEVDGKRVTYASAIRDVNGRTTVNNLAVKRAPFTIKIGTSTYEDARKMYNQLEASSLADDLYIDNLRMIVGQPMEEVVITAYDQQVSAEFLQEIPGGE